MAFPPGILRVGGKQPLPIERNHRCLAPACGPGRRDADAESYTEHPCSLFHKVAEGPGWLHRGEPIPRPLPVKVRNRQVPSKAATA